jgi:CRISPR-associated protein Cas2
VLSGYRLMWILVMFDLPVVRKDERKAASAFRKRLLDLGFEMTQFSVYMRYCTSHSEIDTFTKKVEIALPPGGKVNILTFTDKQYERIVTYYGRRKQPKKRAPAQLALF